MDVTAENAPEPDTMDFQRSWSLCAGERYALNKVVERLRARAGELYSHGKDQEASLVRELAVEFTVDLNDASNRLQGFIAKNRKRS